MKVAVFVGTDVAEGTTSMVGKVVGRGEVEDIEVTGITTRG